MWAIDPCILVMWWKYLDHPYQLALDSGVAGKASKSDRTRSDSCDNTPVPSDFIVQYI